MGKRRVPGVRRGVQVAVEANLVQQPAPSQFQADRQVRELHVAVKWRVRRYDAIAAQVRLRRCGHLAHQSGADCCAGRSSSLVEHRHGPRRGVDWHLHHVKNGVETCMIGSIASVYRVHTSCIKRSQNRGHHCLHIGDSLVEGGVGYVGGIGNRVGKDQSRVVYSGGCCDHSIQSIWKQPDSKGYS